MSEVKIGVIGGSGLYGMEGLTDIESVAVETPFGSPSDEYLLGSLDGVRVAFLPRHGRGHRILPSELNFRANIYGFKKLGIEWLISISAVGSMREDRKPLDIVIPDQFFDRTKNRPSTFFGDGFVGHIAFADPVCPVLSDILYKAGGEAETTIYKGGTYICIEGPQFSTRAESRIYRQWGVDIIGMTNIPEAKLAREAELCYATVALVTDYDCWHETEADVTADYIIANLIKNVETAKKIIKGAVPKIPKERTTCHCASALKEALITSPNLVPSETLQKLGLLIGKYLNK
jgi:5'-methylthioadenosine phosphorylase